ncbi:hypothetical protein [Streptomyces niger]|nr:hypothetical protein [Streptomyces niger]
MTGGCGTGRAVWTAGAEPVGSAPATAMLRAYLDEVASEKRLH